MRVKGGGSYPEHAFRRWAYRAELACILWHCRLTKRVPPKVSTTSKQRLSSLSNAPTALFEGRHPRPVCGASDVCQAQLHK